MSGNTTTGPGAPPRRVYAMGFLDAAGLGMYLAFSAVYLNQAVGMSNQRVGLVLGAAGVTSLIGAIPIGRFASRRGLRSALAFLFTARALSYVGLALAFDFWSALVAAALGGLLNRGIGPLVQTALIAGLDQEGAVAPLARLRALRNAGMAVGALPTGAAVGVGSEWLYRATMASAAVLFVCCAVTALGLPRDADSARARKATKPGLVGNAPFLRLTALYGVLTLSAILLGVGMSLWITQRTDAPPWVVTVNYVLNTVLVVALQTRLARGSEVPERARRMMVGGGALAAVGAAVAPLSGGSGPGGSWGATGFVLLVVVLLTGAEIYVIAGAMSLALVHTPEEHRPTYLATFNLGFGVATVVGPSLISLSLGFGTVGWLAWSALFALGAVACRTIPLVPQRREPAATEDLSGEAPADPAHPTGHAPEGRSR